jgi:hypothetical protein
VAELDALDRIRRRESARISHALFAFQHYHDTLARMATASDLVAERQLEWVPPTDMRKLTAAATPP